MVRNFTKIILKNNIRIYLSDYTDIVNQILNYHKYLPLPNLILANAICAFGPLRFLYESNNLLIRIKSNGAMKSLILEVKDDSIRGLISNPNIETEYDNEKFNSIPLILGIGDGGSVSISREINGEFFTSETPLAKADIVSDLAYFLNQSDQIYSAVINDVKLDEKNPNIVTKAKNALFQLLPNHTEEDITWIEKFIKENKFEDFPIIDYETKIEGKVVDIKNLDGSCWCDKSKITNAIKLFSKEEIEDIFKKKKNIEVVCHFCEKKYKISKGEMYE